MSGYSPPYTQDEQKKIVDYIVEHDAIDLIKGDKLWKDMEQAKIVSRTWQSLKQHFRKRIVYELRYPRYKLSAEVIQMFNVSFNRVPKKSTNRRKKPAPDERKYPKFSTTSSSDTESDLEPPAEKSVIESNQSRATEPSVINVAEESVIESNPSTTRQPSVISIDRSSDSSDDLENASSISNVENVFKVTDEDSEHSQYVVID